MSSSDASAITVEQGMAGHHESWGAEAALDGALFYERALHIAERPVLTDAFDGGQGPAGRLDARVMHEL